MKDRADDEQAYQYPVIDFTLEDDLFIHRESRYSIWPSDISRRISGNILTLSRPSCTMTSAPASSSASHCRNAATIIGSRCAGINPACGPESRSARLPASPPGLPQNQDHA